MMLNTNGLWSSFSRHSRHTITCRAFQSLNTGDFHQDPPQLHNQYTSDWFLQTWLKNKLPPEVSGALGYDPYRYVNVGYATQDSFAPCYSDRYSSGTMYITVTIW